MKRLFVCCGWWLLTLVFCASSAPALAEMVDTGQIACYDNYQEIACPSPGQPFYGQDAQYRGASPHYVDNGDGSVTDLSTGLMWSKGLDGKKLTPEEAAQVAAGMTLGGYHGWRVPTIKELYTLIDFRGYTGTPQGGANRFSSVPADAIPLYQHRLL